MIKMHTPNKELAAENKEKERAPGMIHVAKGMMKVIAQEAIFRSVVGPGFVLSVYYRKNQGGGMAHLPVNINMLTEGEVSSADLRKIGKTIDEFCNNLKKECGSLNDTVFELCGGADILQMLPQHARNGSAQNYAAIIETHLAKWNIRLAKSKVGGTEGRTVILDLYQRKVFVQRAGKGSKAPATFKEVYSPPVNNSSPEVTINMGCAHVGQAPLIMSAILGSCVGISIFDPVTKIGGLAHVMMPVFPGNDEPKAKYADSAVPDLIEKLLKIGANRSRLVSKLAGGANVLFTDGGSFYHISEQNIDNARLALYQAGIDVLEEDVGGRIGRKMIVDIKDFSMTVKLLTGAE